MAPSRRAGPITSSSLTSPAAGSTGLSAGTSTTPDGERGHRLLAAFGPQRSRPQLESQSSMSLALDSLTTFASGA